MSPTDDSPTGEGGGDSTATIAGMMAMVNVSMCLILVLKFHYLQQLIYLFVRMLRTAIYFLLQVLSLR